MSESFNLDRTFCQGSRCNRTKACDRYVGLVLEYSKKHTEFMKYRSISISDWSNYDGSCRLKSYTQASEEDEK